MWEGGVEEGGVWALDCGLGGDCLPAKRFLEKGKGELAWDVLFK